MSKAILLMDMPEGCIDCKFSDVFAEGLICGLNNTCFEGRKGMDERPDWCPLKPLPEKKNMKDLEEYSSRDDYIRINGYNACIDEIMRGSDTSVNDNSECD